MAAIRNRLACQTVQPIGRLARKIGIPMRKCSRAAGVAVGAGGRLTAGAFALARVSAAVSAVTSSKVPAATSSVPRRGRWRWAWRAASAATSVTSLQSVNWAGTRPASGRRPSASCRRSSPRRLWTAPGSPPPTARGRRTGLGWTASGPRQPRSSRPACSRGATAPRRYMRRSGRCSRTRRATRASPSTPATRSACRCTTTGPPASSRCLLRHHQRPEVQPHQGLPGRRHLPAQQRRGDQRGTVRHHHIDRLAAG